MPVEALPVFRVAHILPYLDEFRAIGVPIEAAMTSANLPVRAIENPDYYLPLLPVLAFLEKVSFGEGLDDLGWRVGRQTRTENLSSDLCQTVRSAVTLQCALNALYRQVRSEDSSVTFSTIPAGDCVKLCSHMALAAPPNQCRLSEWNNIQMLLTVVRLYGDAGWQPDEIAFQSSAPVSEIARAALPGTRFSTGQAASWISLPHALLGRPPRGEVPLPQPNKSPESPELMTDGMEGLRDSLGRTLKSYLLEGYPSIQSAAEISGISVRTLQRRLAESKTSYSEVVEHARYGLALELLSDKDMKIVDVAFSTGYEDASNFSRAFHRISGMTPRDYRKFQLEQPGLVS